MIGETVQTEILTNILLVDDRPQNLVALTAILEPLGQNVIQVQSGMQALRELLEREFSVILLDVVMPGLDGFETAAMIKERAKTRHIPIIFLTAASQPEEQITRGYTLGAVDYIAKPFHPDILRAKVSVFVELFRKNEQIRRQAELLRQNEQRERQRELEELRRLGEQRYQDLAESMPQIVWTADHQGRMTYCNRRWYDYAGLPADADGEAWKRVTHLDDLVEMEQAWAAARAGSGAFEVSVRLRRGADATYRWHLVRALSVRGAGPHPQWIGTSTDIDDRKRAEDGLRFLADASKLLADSLDYRRTLAAVAELAVPAIADACAIELCGPDGGVQVLGEALGSGGGPAAGDPGRKAAADRVASSRGGTREHLAGPPAAPCEPSLAEERNSLPASSLNAPILVRGETVGRIRISVHTSGRRFGRVDPPLLEDLALRAGSAIENARLYEAAQNERTSLEEASRAKDEFLAVLSHELRNPMNAILGWTQMLRTGNLPPDTVAVALEALERNSKSQAHLINDILDVSRIITGKLRITSGPADLRLVVEGALATMLPAANEKEIVIVTSIRRDLEPVRGDAERLQQVAWNLLSNAVKFTQRHGRVEVRLERVADRVRLSVRDTGIGIAPQFLPHVFDRFRQADSSNTRVQGGLGLGLSIVRHLVELHGGRVEAHSAGLGQGTTITVELPYQPVHRARGAEPGTGEETDETRLQGLSVLVVEDLEDGRTLLQAMLERCGAAVRTARDAEEALAALEVAWPDVLISDIGLPGENGYELIQRVRRLGRQRRATLAAIALTAYASHSDREQALAAGFHGHVAKPVVREALLRVMVQTIELSRRQSASPPVDQV